MEMCSQCEEYIFECCYTEQKKKYKTVKSKTLVSYFGEDALKECDNCSKQNKQVRIESLKKQLAEEESK
jgi:hypothetical protein